MTLRRNLLFFAILLCCAGSAAAQPSTSPPVKYAPAIAELEKFISRELESKRLPAISIALVDHQTTVWAKGFGFTDAEKKSPATADTVYRVGSVSKLFTDLAVMRLVEQGKLKLDEPITNYLPNFAPKNPSGKPITLRQLMAHHSGLCREPPVGNYFDPVNMSLEKMVASLNDTELVYAPQTKLKYSNAGVATVGYVLEKTQGEPFAKYLKQAVLEPMGMRHSGFEPTHELKKDLAAGIMWTPHGREFPAPTFELGMSPAGSMYSTVNDLAIFLKFLSAPGKGLIDAKSLEQMWTPQFAQPDEKTGVGLGFFISEHHGLRKLGHNGAMYGFATELAYLPDQKLGAVVAISCDCANPVAERIANTALDMMLAVRQDKPLPALPASEPAPAALCAKLAGRWESADGKIALDFTTHGDRLWVVSNRGGTRAELRLAGPDRLVSDDRAAVGTAITVGDNAISVGKATLMKKETPKPAAPPARWRGLIGEYGEDHNILVILERDGRLFALIEWLFMYPLTEEAPNVYRFPEWGLYHDEKLIFERAGEGRATKVVAASVPWVRRPLEDGGTFKIKPVRQLDGLRREALAAEPPKEPGEFRAPDLVDLAALDPTLKFDIRYATTNNFLSTPFYTTAKAFMQKPAAEALLRAHKKLAEKGFGLLIHDAYRPWYVTKMFWEATPAKWHDFVADPMKGSRHNRGCAVDLTLCDLASGKVIEMPGGYDEFSDRSYPDYLGGTSLQRWHRDLLRTAMEAVGFTVYEAEWWHFDYRDWRQYPILNLTFEKLEKEK